MVNSPNIACNWGSYLSLSNRWSFFQAGLSDRLQTRVARQWWDGLFGRHHRTLDECTGILDIVEFVEFAEGLASHVPVLAQLFFALGLQLETSLGETSKLIDLQFTKFEFVEDGIHVGDDNLDAKLFAYVASGIEEPRKHTVFSVAVDKASPCSGSLQNSTITFPNNVAIICCPQAVWVDAS
jgi:hypothetical protein